MCTVTFLPRRDGYCLGMNRDEQLTRAAGLAPRRRELERHQIVLSPSEPGGGTWISLNETGVCLALINWYSVTARVQENAVTRGVVVNSAGVAKSRDEVNAALVRLPLDHINPFRLVGVFPRSHGIVEWQWDLKDLRPKNHPWQPGQWISSGCDEPTAQRIRDETFQRAQKQRTAGSLAWLRRLHRSHRPEPGPNSTCMHRADAATVSYTEIVVSARQSVMRHLAGAPCQAGDWSVHRIEIG